MILIDCFQLIECSIALGTSELCRELGIMQVLNKTVVMMMQMMQMLQKENNKSFYRLVESARLRLTSETRKRHTNFGPLSRHDIHCRTRPKNFVIRSDYLSSHSANFSNLDDDHLIFTPTKLRAL